MTLGFVLLAGAVLAGLIMGFVQLRNAKPKVADGFIYFISAVGGGEMEPPMPIKIGKTTRNPYRDRLPELDTGSPTPLEVILAVYTPTLDLTERLIHHRLKAARVHGEWYDRDMVMAYIDHLIANEVT